MFSIYYVPWSRAVCKRFHDEIRRSYFVVTSNTHGSWSGNILNRKPPRGGSFFRSICTTRTRHLIHWTRHLIHWTRHLIHSCAEQRLHTFPHTHNSNFHTHCPQFNPWPSFPHTLPSFQHMALISTHGPYFHTRPAFPHTHSTKPQPKPSISSRNVPK